MAGLFHPLLCSFCSFTALFPKGTVLLQLLFACLFQGVTLFCVFPVVDRQCLVLARQCREKKKPWLGSHLAACSISYSGTTADFLSTVGGRYLVTLSNGLGLMVG